MKNIVYAFVLLTIIPSAFAASHQNVGNKRVVECRAQVEKQKSEDIKKLDDKRQAMGLGMPLIVYSNKLSRINARYDAKLKKCRALADL